MRRSPPRPTRTDTVFPDTTLSRYAVLQIGHHHADAGLAVGAAVLRQAVVDQHVAERDPLAFEHLQHEPVRAVERRPREALRTQSILRSEEHTSELQSLMRISYAVFCLKKQKNLSTTTL